MATIGQSVSWPGAGAIESFSYSAGHGISPGVATLVTLPRENDKPPAEFGDLVWGDGQRVVRLRGCKMNSFEPQRDGRGLSWVITIFDRRWKWRTPKSSFGGVSGRYNQADDRGKYVPWTLRSPTELAKLCLKAMGETRYEIDMPEGLEQLTGSAYQDFLKLGENFPMSKSNPPVSWDYTPPAEALARLCELFQRRVVYQPISDKILVAVLGEGKRLPTGPYESVGVSIDVPEKPKKIGVVSAPVKYQCRLLLEAVGEEWDGSNLPIDDLSYKPTGRVLGGSKQIMTFTWTGTTGEDGTAEVTISVNLFGVPGATTDYTFRGSGGATPLADNVAYVVTQINAHPDVSRVLIASSSGESLTLTGREDGYQWGTATITDPLVPANAAWTATSQLAQTGELVGGWAYCGPPNYSAVNPTIRLSPDQARQKAQSVYRRFRVLAVDPEKGQGTLVVPGYGPIKRRHQIVLLDSKVEQVVPAPRDPRGGTRDRGQGILPDSYDGFSRSQPAMVYGAVSRFIGAVLWSDSAKNTAPTDRVHVPFSVVPEKQMIAFSEPVYATPSVANVGECYAAPRLLLETAFHIMDADTSALKREEYTRDIGGQAPTEWQIRDDIEVAHIARYTGATTVSRTDRLEYDAKERVGYYLDALEERHGLDQGETRRFIGIYGIDPDGLVQQVSWSIGGGATTTASTNTEHNSDVPPYPARRRNENLPPNTQAAVANLIEEDRVRIGYALGIAVRTAGGG